MVNMASALLFFAEHSPCHSCRNIPLAVSQSTAVECYDHLVAAVGHALPGHIPGDATNACAFLSLLISDLVLEQDRQDKLPEMGVAMDEWRSFAESQQDHVNDA